MYPFLDPRGNKNRFIRNNSMGMAAHVEHLQSLNPGIKAHEEVSELKS